MGGHGGAFLKGAVGGTASILLLSLVLDPIGLRPSLDLAGTVLVFIAGGLIGMAAESMLDRGARGREPH